MSEKEEREGCEHYKRKCQFLTPCCNKTYTCRFCHDEKEKHELNRKEVTLIVCMRCRTHQKVQQCCEKCNICFAQYFCSVCKLFDDEDKKQYHCEGCGICRIGGRDRFFHCPKCDMCLPNKLQNKHKCVEQVSHSNCPVCLEDLHTSRIPSHIPRCGHLIHRTCYRQLINSGFFSCPVCQTSILENMSLLWTYMDNEIRMTPMPREYQRTYVNILCKDCHQESLTRFHIIGLKCMECGSYNTCRSQGALLTRRDDEVSEEDGSVNDAAGVMAEDHLEAQMSDLETEAELVAEALLDAETQFEAVARLEADTAMETDSAGEAESATEADTATDVESEEASGAEGEQFSVL